MPILITTGTLESIHYLHTVYTVTKQCIIMILSGLKLYNGKNLQNILVVSSLSVYFSVI